MIADFFKTIVSPIAGVFQAKEVRKAETALRQIDRLASADDKLAEWESIQAENGRYSWKDEYWTIVLSMPLIGAFVPWLVPFIEKGFEVIAGMPTFYQYWVGVAILTSFGVKLVKK